MEINILKEQEAATASRDDSGFSSYSNMLS